MFIVILGQDTWVMIGCATRLLPWSRFTVLFLQPAKISILLTELDRTTKNNMEESLEQLLWPKYEA